MFHLECEFPLDWIPQNGFSFEEFIKSLPCRHQNPRVPFVALDCGDYYYGCDNF